MQEPPPQQDTYTLVIEAIVGVVIVYFCWQPVYNIASVIVDATLVPLLQALGL